jgi:glutathione synthase/RimK-type ligase-like ATP-grasp enzyme
MYVGLVTWRGLPELAKDDRLLAAALRERGAAVEACVWDDAAVSWTAFDAVVLRSTWDYHLRVDEFHAWLDAMERGGVPLWNPSALVRANLHKSYLLDLAKRGIATVPTELLVRGETRTAREVMRARGWERAVVKPAVSATAYQTVVLDADSDADRDAQSADLLVQPFLEEIATAGEWSFVFLGQDFSHAVLKRPRSGDFRVQNDFGGSAERQVPPAPLLADAQRVVSAITPPWLYARVDGISHDGRLVLMELELTEPSLFLDETAAARFAQAIVAGAVAGS